MRRPGSTRQKILGLILAIGITVILPHVVVGAGRTSSSSGRLRAPMTRPQHSFVPQRFHRFGVSGVGEVGEGQVIIYQQVQSAPSVEAREPATNRIFVPPHWVDGGSGVQVSVPGYWIEPNRAPTR